jgi:hypothetical protein
MFEAIFIPETRILGCIPSCNLVPFIWAMRENLLNNIKKSSSVSLKPDPPTGGMVQDRVYEMSEDGRDDG